MAAPFVKCASGGDIRHGPRCKQPPLAVRLLNLNTNQAAWTLVKPLGLETVST